MRAPGSDLWQVGIIPAPISSLVNPAALAAQRDRIVWLPDPGPWRYLADPFAVRRDNKLHVFVEAFDYRTKHAVIEHHEFGGDLVWRSKQTALAAAVHLSYPFLIEELGDVFMVPESQRLGEIALYRARRFPGDWIREAPLLTGVRGAEASFLRHLDRWWMFFTVVGPKARDQRELHLAYAEQLLGPWTLHPANPVLEDQTGARPGGTPFVDTAGSVILPVQDCSGTYGGAIRFLRFLTLTPDRVEVEHLASRLTGDLVSDQYRDGLHTFSGCDGLTLIDTKRIVHSHARHWINLRRRMTKFWR